MTLIVVLEELLLPLEFLGVQVYTPILVVLTFDRVRVEIICSVITTPFLDH